MTVAYSVGRYEGLSIFDDIYTRMLDEMMDVWMQRSRDEISSSPLDHCQAHLDAAFKVLQERAYAVIENIDRIQAGTDQEGGRESAWLWGRGDLEDLLGLPHGPYWTEDTISDADDH